MKNVKALIAAAVLSSLSFASFAAVEVQSTPDGQQKVGTISASAGTNLGSLEEQLAQSGRPLEVALESHQLVTVGRLVANGLGGSAVPALCRTQMTELGAVCLELDGPVIERRVGVLRSAHHKLSTAAQALLDTLKKAYG